VLYLGAGNSPPRGGGVIFGRAPSVPLYFLLKIGGLLYLVARNGPQKGYIWGGLQYLQEVGIGLPLVVDRAHKSSTGGGVSKIAEMRHQQSGGVNDKPWF
jgi:hypothetical protein